MNRHRAVSVPACTCKLQSCSCAAPDPRPLNGYTGFYQTDYDHCTRQSLSSKILDNHHLCATATAPLASDSLNLTHVNDMSCTCVPSRCVGPAQQGHVGREAWLTRGYSVPPSYEQTSKFNGGCESVIQMGHAVHMGVGPYTQHSSGQAMQRSSGYTLLRDSEHNRQQISGQTMHLGNGQVMQQATVPAIQQGSWQSVHEGSGQTMYLGNGQAIHSGNGQAMNGRSEQAMQQDGGQVRQQGVQHSMPQGIENTTRQLRGSTVQQSSVIVPPPRTELAKQRVSVVIPQGCTCVPLGWCQLTPGKDGRYFTCGAKNDILSRHSNDIGLAGNEYLECLEKRNGESNSAKSCTGRQILPETEAKDYRNEEFRSNDSNFSNKARTDNDLVKSSAGDLDEKFCGLGDEKFAGPFDSLAREDLLRLKIPTFQFPPYLVWNHEDVVCLPAVYTSTTGHFGKLSNSAKNRVVGDTCGTDNYSKMADTVQINSALKVNRLSAEQGMLPYVGQLDNDMTYFGLREEVFAIDRKENRSLVTSTSGEKECQTEEPVVRGLTVSKSQQTDDLSDSYREQEVELKAELEVELKAELLRQRLKLKLYETMLKRVHGSYESLRTRSRIELEDYRARVEQLERCLEKCRTCQHCCPTGTHSTEPFSNNATNSNNLNSDQYTSHTINSAAKLNEMNGDRYTSSTINSGAKSWEAGRGTGQKSADLVTTVAKLDELKWNLALDSGTNFHDLDISCAFSSDTTLHKIGSDTALHKIGSDVAIGKINSGNIGEGEGSSHVNSYTNSDASFRKLGSSSHIVDMGTSLSNHCRSVSGSSDSISCSSRLNSASDSGNNSEDSSCSANSNSKNTASLVDSCESSCVTNTNNSCGPNRLSVEYGNVNQSNRSLNNCRSREVLDNRSSDFGKSKYEKFHCCDGKLDRVSGRDPARRTDPAVEDERQAVEYRNGNRQVRNKEFGVRSVEGGVLTSLGLLNHSLPQIYLSPVVGRDSDSDSERGSHTDHSEKWASTEDLLTDVNQLEHQPIISYSTSHDSTPQLHIQSETWSDVDSKIYSNYTSSNWHKNTSDYTKYVSNTKEQSVAMTENHQQKLLMAKSISKENINTPTTVIRGNSATTATRKLSSQSEHAIVVARRQISDDGYDQLEENGYKDEERTPTSSLLRRGVRRSFSDVTITPLVTPRNKMVDAEEATTIERLRSELAGKESSLKKLRAALKEMSSSHGELLENNFQLQDHLKVLRTPSQSHSGSYSSSGCSSSSGTWRRSARKPAAHLTPAAGGQQSKSSSAAVRQLSLVLGSDGLIEDEEGGLLRGGEEFSDISPTSTDSICFTPMKPDRTNGPTDGLVVSSYSNLSSSSSTAHDSGFIYSSHQQLKKQQLQYQQPQQYQQLQCQQPQQVQQLQYQQQLGPQDTLQQTLERTQLSLLKPWRID